MKEFYFLTLIARFESVLTAVFLFALLAYALFFGLWLCFKNDVGDEWSDKTKKYFRPFTITIIIITIFKIFTPSERDLMLIYGIGGTVDYIKQNETAKQLPDKVIMAIDKYLDEQK